MLKTAKYKFLIAALVTGGLVGFSSTGFAQVPDAPPPEVPDQAPPVFEDGVVPPDTPAEPDAPPVTPPADPPAGPLADE